MASRILSLCLTSLLLLNGAKNPDWRSGTILDCRVTESLEAEARIWPSLSTSPEEATYGGSWAAVPSHGLRETVVVEVASGERVIATRLVRTSKPSPLSGLREVRLAVTNGTVVILDQKGREHKFKLRTTQPQHTRP